MAQPLPPKLAAALHHAGFGSLAELARSTGYEEQTLWSVRSKRVDVSPRMAARIGDALDVPAALVPTLLQERTR